MEDDFSPHAVVKMVGKLLTVLNVEWGTESDGTILDPEPVVT